MKTQALFLLIVLLSAPVVWRLPSRWRGEAMGLITFCTIAVVAPFSLLLMLSTAFLQWLVWNRLRGAVRVSLVVSVIISLIPLLVYKWGAERRDWLIPLGLSYYAFRQIHVAFEVYKQTMQPPTLKSYGIYLLFLPVLLIGPIHRMPDFERSLRRMKWNAVTFSDGLERILYGLVKINFLGNFLFSLELTKYARSLPPAGRLYAETVAFTGNAYFQFAGFSDLAIGAGLLWGIRVMENFNAPFAATNMQEFWRRWHISLSSWCRDYVFDPILASTRNRWFALIASMLVLALWHEISFRYVAWGALQALFILGTVRARNRWPRFAQFLNNHPAGRWLGRIWVFHLFAFSCILIGWENISYVRQWLKH